MGACARAFPNNDQLISFFYKSTKEIQWRQDVFLPTKVLKQVHANEELSFRLILHYTSD